MFVENYVSTYIAEGERSPWIRRQFMTYPGFPASPLPQCPVPSPPRIGCGRPPASRVYAAAEALHYQPSAIARAMARQQTDKIAFLICKEGATILDEFYAGICEGVMRRDNGTPYQLVISTADEWQNTAQSKQIEGVILAGTPRRP